MIIKLLALILIAIALTSCGLAPPECMIGH
jgi:hypothetical protein